MASVSERTVVFECIENARELGGLRTEDGRVIKSGLLLRCGNLSRASDADVVVLKDRFHLTDVFDFRFDAEAAADPDRQIEGVRYTSLSTLPKAFIGGFSDGRADSEQVKSADFVAALVQYAFLPKAQEMSRRLYPAIVFDPVSQRLYGEFLRGVLGARGGALWHCSQGKDRAGWGAAFLLAALGASRETVLDDFDRSNVYFAPFLERFTAKVEAMGGGDAEKEFIRSMIGVNTDNFVRTLDLIDSDYGSMDAYLENALGFSAEEQKALRDKYLDAE